MIDLGAFIDSITVACWILAAWLALALVVALIIGAVVKRRDEQQPASEREHQHD